MAKKIGIISDTHGLLRPEVLEILKTCDCILHAGDVDRPEILDQLRPLGNLYAVRGNNDGDWARGIATALRFKIENISFFMTHNKKDVAWDLNDRLWLNPGSCGRSRFGQEPTMAVLSVDNKSWKIEKINLSA